MICQPCAAKWGLICCIWQLTTVTKCPDIWYWLFLQGSWHWWTGKGNNVVLQGQHPRPATAPPHTHCLWSHSRTGESERRHGSSPLDLFSILNLHSSVNPWRGLPLILLQGYRSQFRVKKKKKKGKVKRLKKWKESCHVLQQWQVWFYILNERFFSYSLEQEQKCLQWPKKWFESSAFDLTARWQCSMGPACVCVRACVRATFSAERTLFSLASTNQIKGIILI